MTDQELCKKLYHLTSWVITEGNVYCHGRLRSLKIYVDTSDVHEHIPDYSTDYLLTKLPPYIATHGQKGDDYLLELKPNFDGNEWEAAYWGIQKALYWQRGDTPKTALLKLAIELAKAGVIGKEGE